jgi:hypothetical protein
MMNASAEAVPRKSPFIFQVLINPLAAAAWMILLLTFWILPIQAAAQTISVGSVSGQAGTAVDLRINFTAGATGVATLQFDLAFPSSLSLVSTTTGAAATSAGKSANGSTISGGVRVLIFGLNQNLIGSGEVVIVRLNIAAGTPPGTIAVTIGNIVASDALGLNVTASGTSGSVTVAGQGDVTPPVISAVASSGISQSAATITWTTNEASDTQVEYGITLAYGSSTVLNSSLVTSHSQTLTGLAAGTTYHYRVKSRDAAGNLATSSDFTFTTQTSTDTVPPVIEGVTATNVTHSSATIVWTTNEAADSQVEYGVTSSYGNTTTRNLNLVNTHTEVLSGLIPETIYHYRVLSRDAAGNVAASGGFTFTTLADNDTTPPVISGVTSTNVTSNSARISWTTSEPADTQVDYGTTIFYGNSTSLNPAMTTSHAQTLTGLSAKTTYHYRVRSRDGSGNLAVSDDYIFRTGDTQGDFIPVTTFFYPRLLTSPTSEPGSPNQEFIGFAITNLDSSPARLRFTAYNIAGNEATGPEVTNPVIRDLLPGAQVPLVDYQIFGSGFSGPNSIGWVKIESTVGKVAGFFMMFNAGLTELDGANVTTNPLTSFIYPEIDAQGFTKISIANPNPDPATLTLDLTRSDGTIQSSATRNLPANGSLAADLFTDIFPGSNPTGDGYVRVTSNQGVLPFELIGKSTQYLGSLNGQDAAQGASTLYCPQFVFGETWYTTLSVVNLDNRPGTVTFRFIRDDASQLGATKVVPIDARGKIYIDDDSFFQSFIVAPGGALIQGYVEIVSTDVQLAGSVVFGDPERTAFASALPLVSTLDRSFIFSHLASNNQYFTGVAILNPGPFDAAVDIEVYKADGTLDRTTKVFVPRLRRVARLLTEIFPELEGQERISGYFKVLSTQPLATFALFGTRSLSALSAIPPQVVK